MSSDALLYLACGLVLLNLAAFVLIIRLWRRMRAQDEIIALTENGELP